MPFLVFRWDAAGVNARLASYVPYPCHPARSSAAAQGIRSLRGVAASNSVHPSSDSSGT